MVPEPVPMVPVNGGAVSPKHTDVVAVVMVPTEEITFSTIVKEAIELPQEAPSVTITSITSPPEMVRL